VSALPIFPSGSPIKKPPILVSCPGDFVRADATGRIGVGPAEGLLADLEYARIYLRNFLARSATEVNTPRRIATGGVAEPASSVS
jgi:hypothetical protein